MQPTTTPMTPFRGRESLRVRGERSTFVWTLLSLPLSILVIGAVLQHQITYSELALLVTTPEIAALRRTHACLRLLQGLEFPTSKVQLVLNRHDARFHHGRAEVAWHLGAPIVGLIPFDHAAAERATAQQRPLVVDSNSRASRALLSLAEGIHTTRLRLPVEPGNAAGADRWWRRLLPGGTPDALRRPAQLPVAAGQGRRGQAW